jgi:hypothetical protein
MPRQIAAVLLAAGTPSVADRPRFASYGAGVTTPGTAQVGVEVITESQVSARPYKRIVNLTRFSPGTTIPPEFRVVTELTPDEGITPASISGLLLWLAADRLSGFNDGDLVTSFTDQSGAGNHAVGAGAARPTYKTAIANGLPVLRFAAAQTMVTGLYAVAPSLFTILVVGSKRLNDSARQDFCDGIGSGTRSIVYAHAASNVIGMASGAAGTMAATITNLNAYIAVFNNASSRLSVNGGTATATTMINQTVTGLRLGTQFDAGGEKLDGDIAEIAVYNRALTLAEVATLAAYAGRWGITIG